MSKRIEMVAGTLQEAIKLREIAISRLEKELERSKGWIEFLRGEIGVLSQSVPIMQNGSALKRAALYLGRSKGRENLKDFGRSPVNIRRDFNSVFAKIFLFVGASKMLTMSEMTQIAEQLRLILPHQRHAFRTEPGKIAQKEGFRVLRRRRDQKSGGYIYGLSNSAQKELRKKLEKPISYKGNAEKVCLLEHLFERTDRKK